MVVRLVSDESTSICEWNAFAAASPHASLYHLYGWRRVIRETFGHPTYYLSAVSASDDVVGFLPLVHLKSRVFGNMLVSLPFFNYGGLCAESDEASRGLLQAAVDLARDTKADFIEIRQDREWNSGLPVKEAKVSMRLALPETSSLLWKQIGSKVRNQVEKPRKAGVTTIVGRDDQLDAFYDVFSTNMRDLGTPVYPKAFFRNILTEFPEQTWIVTAYLGDTAVAAGFLAGWRERIEIPWASSLRSFSGTSANMLMYWRALEFACERGYREFDFGRSSPDAGTYRFKAQWGATPVQLYWHYWLKDGGQIPQVNPNNPKYRTAIAVWRRLPLGLTRRVGPSIVKYIP